MKVKEERYFENDNLIDGLTISKSYGNPTPINGDVIRFGRHLVKTAAAAYKFKLLVK